jgi:hypothetical protein
MGALQDIIDELKPLILGAFGMVETTDPDKMNFFTSVQGAVQNFPQEVRADSIELPCAVLEIGTFTPDTDWGVDNPNMKRFSVCAHKVVKQSITENQDTVNDSALNFVWVMDNTSTFNHFQVMEPGVVQSDLDSPINALLVGSKNPIVSACGRYDPGFSCEIIHTP